MRQSLYLNKLSLTLNSNKDLAYSIILYFKNLITFAVAKAIENLNIQQYNKVYLYNLIAQAGTWTIKIFPIMFLF